MAEEEEEEEKQLVVLNAEECPSVVQRRQATDGCCAKMGSGKQHSSSRSHRYVTGDVTTTSRPFTKA